MQVIEMTASGDPEVLTVAERAAPVAATGELLIRVAYAGVNGPDLMQRKGLWVPRKTSTGWGFGGRDMISCNVSR